MPYIGLMIRPTVIASIMIFAAPAFAQASEPLPRFEALEQQQQMVEQREFDNLEANRQRDQMRSMAPFPASARPSRPYAGWNMIAPEMIA